MRNNTGTSNQADRRTKLTPYDVLQGVLAYFWPYVGQLFKNSHTGQVITYFERPVDHLSLAIHRAPSYFGPRHVLINWGRQMARFFYLTACLMLMGCPGFGTLTPDEFLPEGEITYLNSVKALLDAKCATCHANKPIAGAPNSIVTYEEAYDLRDRIIVRAVTDMTMPPGAPLSPEEQAILTRWVDTGAREGDPPMPVDGGLDDVGVPVDGGPRALTWDDGVDQIMSDRCASAGCHAIDNPASQLDLSSYAGYLAGGISGDLRGDGDPDMSLFIDHLWARNGTLLMPLGGPMLESDLIEALEAWVKAGSPEK